jgi:hypothetical protein
MDRNQSVWVLDGKTDTSYNAFIVNGSAFDERKTDGKWLVCIKWESTRECEWVPVQKLVKPASTRSRKERSYSPYTHEDLKALSEAHGLRNLPPADALEGTTAQNAVLVSSSESNDHLGSYEQENGDEETDSQSPRSAGPPSHGENSYVRSSEDEDEFSIDATVVQTHPPNAGLATPESTTIDDYGEEGDYGREIYVVESSKDVDEQTFVQLQSPAGVSSLGTITESGYNADCDGGEEEENCSSDDDTSAAIPQLGGNTDSALSPGAVLESRNRKDGESFVLIKLKLYIHYVSDLFSFRYCRIVT